MVMVDTTVWIDYLRGIRTAESDWFDRELTHQRFGLTDLILCEVLQGISDERAAERVYRELCAFELFDTGGQRLALETARNFRVLRTRGRTIRKTIDGLIATFCLLKGFSLLHRDRDYNHFEEILGLSVVHP